MVPGCPLSTLAVWPEAAGASPPPLTPARALAAWQPAPPAAAALLAVAVAYLWCTLRVRRRHPGRPWPLTRTLAFLLGLAVIAVATQGAPGVYDGVLFSAHMVQHVLLIMVAPPLLVFGRPVTLALHAARNPAHAWLRGIVRSRVVTALTWPPATAVAYAVVVAGTHTPPVMDLVLTSSAAHTAEHFLYLACGYLFFLPIAGSEPVRWRVSMPARYLMLLAAMQVDTVVGVVLMVVGHNIFPAYARTGRTWGPAGVADVHDGGVIMWAGSDIVMIVLAVAVAVAFIHGPRSAGRAGGWVEGIRARALLGRAGAGAAQAVPGATGARVAVARARPAAGDIDTDEAWLAAYNAYLAGLGREEPPGQPAAG